MRLAGGGWTAGQGEILMSLKCHHNVIVYEGAIVVITIIAVVVVVVVVTTFGLFNV